VPMKNPPHPGLIVRDICLEENGFSVAEGAAILGVSRQQLHNVIAGRSGVSAEMAVRLEKAFGSTADHWLRMQTAYDLAQVRAREGKIKVARVAGRTAAKRRFERASSVA
jgi:antitoxin HigA-1